VKRRTETDIKAIDVTAKQKRCCSRHPLIMIGHESAKTASLIIDVRYCCNNSCYTLCLKKTWRRIFCNNFVNSVNQFWKFFFTVGNSSELSTK